MLSEVRSDQQDESDEDPSAVTLHEAGRQRFPLPVLRNQHKTAEGRSNKQPDGICAQRLGERGEKTAWEVLGSHL